MLALRGPLFGKLFVSAGNSEIPFAHVELGPVRVGRELKTPFHEQLAPASLDLASAGCACGKVPEFVHAPATANDGMHGQPSCLDLSGGSAFDKSCWATYYQCSDGAWCEQMCMCTADCPDPDPGRSCTQDKGMDDSLIELFGRQKRQCLSPAAGAQRNPTIFLLGDSHALYWKHALRQAVSGKFDVRSWARARFNEC
jgi:hypothetical protein